MRKLISPFLAIVWLLAACQSSKPLVFPAYEANQTPPPPDYARNEHWAALPQQADKADLVPGKTGQLTDQQANARVDIFFLHPTIYTQNTVSTSPWNGDVNNSGLNNRVDESTIKNQASVFNGAGQIYAPRYRQAHYNVFLTPDHQLKNRVLDTAYADVKAAFLYYLEHFNQGRPFILASHSQGSIHAARLVKEVIEGRALQQQLVAAYLVGIAFPKVLYPKLPPCENPEDTNCWMSWNTYAVNYFPPRYEEDYKNALSTNPLNWKTDNSLVSRKENKGGVLRNFSKIHPRLTDAQNHEGLLWIHKPRFFGNFLLHMKRYHIADYNLFYLNIRENAILRTKKYLEKQQPAETTRE
jgi:Protein of unknown function (DUF3089)